MEVRKSPPLPFQGNKQNFRVQFLELLKNYDDSYTFVDIFGGSGYLSYLTKYTFPNARVIYNDFDNYSERLAHVEETNKLMLECKEIFDRSKSKRSERLEPELTKEIYDLVQKHIDNGDYVDLISISRKTVFSGVVCKTMKQFRSLTLYHVAKIKKYEVGDYLKGLEVVHLDYKELYEKFKGKDKVVFFIDPPYYNTNTFTYSDTFDINDHLNCLKMLEEKNFIYFTCDKSFTLPMLKWLEKEFGSKWLEGVKYNIKKPRMYKSVEGFRDIMFWKKT